jgi:hypothetical protein
MVKDQVWRQARLRPNDVICVPCLEARLCRALRLDDFKRVEINNPSFGQKGPTLLQRLRGWQTLPRNYRPKPEDML